MWFALLYFNRKVTTELKLQQVLFTWDDFTTIKQWKNGLKITQRNRLSKRTVIDHPN